MGLAHRELRFHWLMLLLAIGVLSLSAMLHVRDGRQVLLPIWNVPLPSLCTFKRVSGFDCPGCGLTRSFISLAGGDLASAWRYNAAGIFLFLLLVFQIPYRLLQLWRAWSGRCEFQLHSAGLAWLLLLSFALVAQWFFKLVARLV